MGGSPSAPSPPPLPAARIERAEPLEVKDVVLGGEDEIKGTKARGKRGLIRPVSKSAGLAV